MFVLKCEGLGRLQKVCLALFILCARLMPLGSLGNGSFPAVKLFLLGFLTESRIKRPGFSQLLRHSAHRRFRR